MLRILMGLAFASLCVLTPTALLATEPDARDLGSARVQSQHAIEQARRLSRDAEFNSRIRRNGDHALSAAGQASRDAVSSLNSFDLPEMDEQTWARAREDIKALLADPQPAASESSSPDDSNPPPLIFISFSMPEASLRSLLTEAASTDSALVLRGLVENSMKRTVARLGELLGTQDDDTPGAPTPSLAIDPTLFERFKVDMVPAFVLPQDAIAACTPEGCPVPEHLKVAGDVSLAYALGVMAREAGDTPLGDRAEQWRQRLEEEP